MRRTGAAARRDRGASTLEWVGMILVIAAVTGVIAVSRVPGDVSTGITSAICEVAQQSGCAPPRGDQPAAGRRPAGPPDRQAAPARAPVVADAAARKASGPPTPPDAKTARERLAELKVATEGDDDDYDRDEFPHWAEQEDDCDTREAVLKRDGEGVETAGDCYPTAGSWYSPYDGETWDDPADVDIDHLVPLAEAWRSGADEWSKEEREAFANDLDRAQLWAVTDNVNQEKGDKDPADWLPPNEEIHCVYARAWVDVKSHWKLTVDKAEKQALTEILDGC